ncbi:MAG TPA: hypothetical protein VMV53_06900 [Acidimicrobiales bacterium]|nr:hypothetical protein [Acidimicrobiales bacterium]
MSVFPELVTGREDGFGSRAWRVEQGSTFRGEASCNLTERILEVPFGDDTVSRVVRAHELMHARVSPHTVGWPRRFGDVAPRALECAEELRVNTLIARLGFDVALLCDGSEKSGGARLARMDEWDQAVCFLLAVLATGAERAYLAGIRSERPEWMAGLRAVRKRALGLLDGCGTDAMGATSPDDEGVPGGYAQVTVVLARMLTQAMAARSPQDPAALRQFRRSLEPGGRRAPTGRFADLQLDEGAAMVSRTRSGGVRRRRPAASGTVMRYPGRLLSDPQRRAFVERARRFGGVVVIDQSGSMDIDVDELARLMRHAPNALVIGYSHRPGDRGSTPNAWVLAERGGVAAEPRTGNVGNGVDGPVLRWALNQRQDREPVLWVTDGQVTDSHDHPDEALTGECAHLVVGGHVLMVRDLAGATVALRYPRALRQRDVAAFGRVGRRILENRGP